MKIFVSIGSGTGIGFATASHFAKNGFKVILMGRTKARLESMTNQLQHDGMLADYRVLDASDSVAVQSVLEQIINQEGSIDVLHYNAASLREATLASQPIETFISDLAVNLGGAMVATKVVEPFMEKAGKGTILLTGGGFAFDPKPDFLSLSIGKSGIRTLSIALFPSLKEKNIHISTINVFAHVNGDVEVANRIAATFWHTYALEKTHWSAEVSYPAVISTIDE